LGGFALEFAAFLAVGAGEVPAGALARRAGLELDLAELLFVASGIW
jgi:hypothetical protein